MKTNPWFLESLIFMMHIYEKSIRVCRRPDTPRDLCLVLFLIVIPVLWFFVDCREDGKLHPVIIFN